MRIELVSFCEKSEYQKLADDFVKRSSRFADVKITRIDKKRLKKEQQKKASENAAFLNFLQPTDFVVLCDEKGKEFSSEKFAATLERWSLQASKRVVIAIGGAYGWDESVRKNADVQLSLSKLTMNHRLAELVLAEQVYRALTLLNGHPYHNS